MKDKVFASVYFPRLHSFAKNILRLQNVYWFVTFWPKIGWKFRDFTNHIFTIKHFVTDASSNFWTTFWDGFLRLNVCWRAVVVHCWQRGLSQYQRTRVRIHSSAIFSQQLFTVCREDRNKEKEPGNGPFLADILTIPFYVMF